MNLSVRKISGQLTQPIQCRNFYVYCEWFCAAGLLFSFTSIIRNNKVTKQALSIKFAASSHISG